ncbi:SERPINI1 family protein [Megaselia abdita]
MGIKDVFFRLLNKPKGSSLSGHDRYMENSVIFSRELFSTITDDDDTNNIIISPLSIEITLALALTGASGETAKEIFEGLHLTSATIEEELLVSYKENKLVKIANKIYVNQDYKFKESFKEITGKSFNSEADTLNVADSAASAEKINKWVEKKTSNKIKDLISPLVINESTRLVLVNAIYFKGNWAKKFNPENTMKYGFFHNENDFVDVDMMVITTTFKYGNFNDLNATILELPYANSELSMLIVLPNQIMGLKDVMTKMKKKSIFKISQKMFDTKVRVMLPKFKVEYNIELTKTLKKMGITKMFSNEAEFENMLEQHEDLYISTVVHKAFIEVNEEGTEAAGASAMIATKKCIGSRPNPIKTFIADHPFFYIIWDTKNILFSGQNVSFD